MQAIMETLFDIFYLVGVVVLGVLMLKNGKKREHRLFGLMAVILGAGDSFHLVPRAIALCTTGLEAHAAALGVGKLVTSITMTVFYVLLYHVYCLRYEKREKNVTLAVYVLAAARVLLCLLPQNDWLAYRQPLLFGVLRNVPFAILGGLIIYLFYKETRARGDRAFSPMPLAITLSFAMYIPVVLFSGLYPLVGVLMIPKTLAYVWIVVMGYQDMRKNAK